MIYYPMHMHMHTCHQPGASMEGHIYNASLLGMKYIRFTDHDNRVGLKKNALKSFDFSRGELSYEYAQGVSCTWDLIGEPKISFSDGCLEMSGKDGEISGIKLRTKGKNHSISLMSELSLKLGMTFSQNAKSRIIVAVTLSERPPEHVTASLRYVIGEISPNLPPHTVEIPITAPTADGIYELHVSDDARFNDELGGLDNAFSTVSVLVDGSATVRLNLFEIHNELCGQEVLDRQRVLADEIGARYGVKPFVTTEISSAGQHKNVFSTKVPLIDYSKFDFNVTAEQAIAHVVAYGGIFSYNHPFDHPGVKYRNMNLSPSDLEALVVSEGEKLIANRVYGAALMEVGFPLGRAPFTVHDHLRLWDNIGLAGIFITGYGDSDNHNNDTGWFDGNNFATWIGVDEGYSHPIDEEVFIESMKSGKVYMGDPVFLKGAVSFSSGNATFGDIIAVSDGDLDKRSFKFELGEAKTGWCARAICNGEELLKEYASEDGKLSLDFEVLPTLPVNLVRVEAYNADGKCILLTNPIYMVKKSEFSGEIPDFRLTKGSEVL